MLEVVGSLTHYTYNSLQIYKEKSEPLTSMATNQVLHQLITPSHCHKYINIVVINIFVSNHLTYPNLEMHFLLCLVQIKTNDHFYPSCLKNVIIELDKVHKTSNHV